MSFPRNKEDHKKGEKRSPYEPPCIIYKGKISTRAGSPLSNDGLVDPGTGVTDPADLFGN